jgi:2',3'-cyclic-nucleotide 2'-phosphodiesterase (5'-nucleotidase family)
MRRLLAGFLATLAVGAAGAGELAVMHVNDVHGYCFPRDFRGEQLPKARLGDRMGGLFSAATLRKRLVAGDFGEKPDATLFLDAGDWFGGTLYGEETRGSAIADVFADPALGIDATVFGNHAWDYGTKALNAFLRKLDGKIPVLGANTRHRGRARLPASVIFERGGKRIGVVGLVTDGALRATVKENVGAWTVQNEFQVLRKVLPDLRAKCDYVILLSHIGYGRDRKKQKAMDAFDDEDPTLNVDLIIDGHSHRNEELWADEDTFVVQADHYGMRAGIVRIPFGDDGFGKPKAERYLLDAKAFPPDAGMAKRHRTHVEARARVEGKVLVKAEAGVSAPHLLRTDGTTLRSKMGDLVCQALLRAARAEGHEPDFSVAYHGGVRAGIYALEGGFTAGDFHAVSPFGGEAVVVELPGKMWRSNGLRRAHTTRGRASYGNAFLRAEDDGGERRLVSFEVDGEPLQDDSRYTIVTDDFMAGWFRGKGVRKTPLRVTPKQAVVTMLRKESRRRPLSQAQLDALAPASSELVFLGRKKRPRKRRGRGGE